MKKYLVWGLILVLASGLFLYRKTLVATLSPGFRFEKYKTAADAKRALLQLHPVGSNVDDLLGTLKPLEVKLRDDENGENPFTAFIYMEDRLFYSYEWGIIIDRSKEDVNKIRKLSVWRYYVGF